VTTTAAAALAALPDTRHEDWRYTDLAPLKARAWIEEKGSGPFSLSFDDAEPVTRVVRLGEHANGASLLTHRIALRANQQATLVLHEVGGDAPCLALHNLDIELGDNASLTLYRIQQPGAATNLISRLDARVGRDARFTCIGLYAGGALVRNDLNVALDAPGAQAELHGVLAPAAGQHLDVHTRLDHRAPHGRSRETFRCLVPEKARAIFNGKVIVQPGAQKTDSEQHVDSLLLGPGAEVNAKPELEIYADDVKCAHGATCGQLAEDAIYYLRTRGLDEAQARKLLLHTFAHEVLKHIAHEPARALADELLRSRL
jgi:Fe-S cluster assembly protein SufD